MLLSRRNPNPGGSLWPGDAAIQKERDRLCDLHAKDPVRYAKASEISYTTPMSFQDAWDSLEE